jgi:hypothetical protein
VFAANDAIALDVAIVSLSDFVEIIRINA